MINGMIRRPCEVEFIPPDANWDAASANLHRITVADWKHRVSSFVRNS
jgi:hypothetical protein